MKQSEIKELSVAELTEKLGETKKSYSDLKLSHAISPLENPVQLRSLRYSSVSYLLKFVSIPSKAPSKSTT